MQTARPGAGSAEMSMTLPERAELFSVICPEDGGSLPAADAPHVVICAEETGGTNALIPVLPELRAANIGMTVLAAGNGARLLREKGYLSDPLSSWPEAALDPSAVLVTPSEDGRLERDLFSRFLRSPKVVIEDYHESSRRAIKAAADMGLLLPTVCAVDKEAERLIHRRFPNLPVPVEITGSPTFDMLAGEDVAAVQAQSRNELKVSPDKTLIAFLMPRLGKLSLHLAQQVADVFKDMGDEYLFAPRRHPSDSIGQEEYEQLFADLPTVDTVGLPSEKVSNAADLAITGRSITGLREVVRQRLSITLTEGLAPDFTFPTVDAGASVPARPADLPWLVPELLEGTSLRCQNLRQNMLPFQADGGAAARVAAIVRQAAGLAGA